MSLCIAIRGLQEISYLVYDDRLRSIGKEMLFSVSRIASTFSVVFTGFLLEDFRVWLILTAFSCSLAVACLSTILITFGRRHKLKYDSKKR